MKSQQNRIELVTRPGQVGFRHPSLPSPSQLPEQLVVGAGVVDLRKDPHPVGHGPQPQQPVQGAPGRLPGTRLNPETGDGLQQLNGNPPAGHLTH